MGDANSEVVISDFLSTIGNTPYLAINETYPDSSGQPATSSENADKCQNTFGQTYLASNGARANVRLGSAGDYLIPAVDTLRNLFSI
ncbi:MAG TPA: hypothetical protein VJ875_18820 [Pyrinomonadaceae bacterium]|nr:hypothetical protein [Pyrinomonadaceae bacterium]